MSSGFQFLIVKLKYSFNTSSIQTTSSKQKKELGNKFLELTLGQIGLVTTTLLCTRKLPDALNELYGVEASPKMSESASELRANIFWPGPGNTTNMTFIQTIPCWNAMLRRLAFLTNLHKRDVNEATFASFALKEAHQVLEMLINCR